MEWSTSDKGDHIECANGIIQSTATELNTHKSLIRTSEPIPSRIDDFHFESVITKCSGIGTLFIGLTSNNPESRNGHSVGSDPGTIGLAIYFREDGCEWAINFDTQLRVKSGSVIIKPGDKLTCQLKQFLVKGVSYKICSFQISGKVVGEPIYINLVELFPTIGMNLPKAVVTTSFGIEAFYNRAKGILKTLFLHTSPNYFLIPFCKAAVIISSRA